MKLETPKGSLNAFKEKKGGSSQSSLYQEESRTAPSLHRPIVSVLPKTEESDECSRSDEALEEEENLALNAQQSAAALAAASPSSLDVSLSFKNFRHHPDMENFYRFIYENDLRVEALAILDKELLDRSQKKNGKLLKH